MRHFAPSVRAVVCALTLTCLTPFAGAATASPAGVAGPVFNPLTTPDQLLLEQLAERIVSNPVVRQAKHDVEQQAIAAVTAAHGPISAADRARADRDYEEEAFSAAQIAVDADPYRPHVLATIMPPHNWLGVDVPGSRYAWDNPDTTYRIIPMDGSSSYVIRGKVVPQRPVDWNFSLVDDVTDFGLVGNIGIHDLEVAPDGSFTITVDNRPADGRVNHLQSTPDTAQLFVRNTTTDPAGQTPIALEVQRIAGPPPPPPMTEQEMANLAASVLMRGAAKRQAYLLQSLSTPANVIPAPPPPNTIPGTLTTQQQSLANFRIDDDTAVVITVDPGGAGYFVVPVTDTWMVTPDFAHHTSSLNNEQAVPNPDGTYTLVLSLEDPGYRNWIDPDGLTNGTLFVRWQVLSDRLPERGGPAISAKVVSVSSLAAAVPPGMATVTATERAAQLAARAAGYERRFQPVL